MVKDKKHVVRDKFTGILKHLLPAIKEDREKVVYAQIMLALKLDGVIGEEISEKDERMIRTIQESIMSSQENTERALLVAERIMGS